MRQPRRLGIVKWVTIGYNKVGPQEVRVGYEYILKTSEFELTGLISALEVTDG